MSKPKLSRMETNKIARSILSRHSVDLGYCQFSCYGSDVLLTGWLCKTDASDFTGPQVEAIIHDFMRKIPGCTVTGDLDNWNFNSERITFLGDEKEFAQVNGEDDVQTMFEIDPDDYDFEAS